MSLREKKYEADLETDRAENVRGEVIYIDFAESGRKGYSCLGCGKPMQANIQRKNPKYKSYFSHVPVDLSKGEKKCTYSNREQRELIATDILQRLKRIKVPSVLKYPPNGTKGNPVELSKAKFIEAHHVRSQVTFYEDEEGNVLSDKNPKVLEKYLLMRPDVVFYNHKDQPILFVELVDTHKVSDEKKIKLRRLGVNTVSVIVPRGSDQEIEDNFKSVERVKWEYNEEESNTNYVSVSHRAPKGILEFDEYQRRIFKESVRCRNSRLNNLIRSLTKCLERESYSNVERDFEREIFRIENATAALKERLEEKERRIDSEVRTQFTEQNINLERQRGKLDDSEREFQKKSIELEGRYRSTKENIRRDFERADRDKRTELQDGGTKEQIEERFKRGRDELRSEFEGISEEFRSAINSKKESIQNITGETERLAERFDRLESEERERHNLELSGNKERFEAQFRIEEEELSEKIKREERIIEELRAKEGSLREEFEQLEQKESNHFRDRRAQIKEEEGRTVREIRDTEKTLREEFRDLEEQEYRSLREAELRILNEEGRFEETIREEFIRELNESTNGFPRRIKHVLEAERVGNDYKDAQRQEEYYKRARELFNKGAWKAW